MVVSILLALGIIVGLSLTCAAIADAKDTRWDGPLGAIAGLGGGLLLVCIIQFIDRIWL